jgi:ATPase family associated with various cellular activities (AAA)
VVDHLLFQQVNSPKSLEPHASHRLEDVPITEIHLCAPTVGGYSLVSKTWGRFVADRLSEIVWDDDAFSHLVLEDDKKNLIKNIVSVDHSNLITDVVSGKSGGFIVVLHGKPGTGKTLTAEAAAEKIRKPLMIVSGAELASPGPGPAVGVERLLQNVFDLAKAWDALVLIDEAEVYLEARSFGDVQRNAMVSIFLRLLEYHHQVIFLTTNHITRLDSAFKSRIAIAIRYPDLTAGAREEIWRRFLRSAGVTIVENEETVKPNEITKAELAILIAIELNGRYRPRHAESSTYPRRQIKNAVRTVQACSYGNKVPISFTLLQNIVETATDFGDFEGACECQKRKIGYFGGDDFGSHLQDLKAKWGKIPV